MARETLDLQIQNQLNQILVLGSMVEKAMIDSVNALKQDLVSAKTLYDNDQLINEKYFAIEGELIKIIATQQPIMAGDLRLMASMLDVNTELERMGDYAKGIAKICLIIGKQPFLKPLVDVPRMADIGVAMLHDAVCIRRKRRRDSPGNPAARRRSRSALQPDLPRTGDLHDLRSIDDRPGQLPDVGGAQPGAFCRPGDQHLRAHDLRC